MISGIRDLAAGFERASGHKVIASQERNVMDKVNTDAPADVVTRQSAGDRRPDQAGQGGGPRASTSRAPASALPSRRARPSPTLRTTEDFVRMLRNAKSIGYSTVGSGLMAANIIKNLGLTEELKARTKFLDGFPAAEAVARGEVEIALQQINVILPVEGRRARRPVAGGAAAIQPLRGRRARGLEGARGRDRAGEVHGRAGERGAGAQERTGAAGALTLSIEQYEQAT